MSRQRDWDAGFNAALQYIVDERKTHGLFAYGCEEWRLYQSKRMGFQRWNSLWAFLADLCGLRSWMLRRAERTERRKLWKQLDRARAKSMRAYLQGRPA